MKKTFLFILLGAAALILMLTACREPRAYRIPDDVLKQMPTRELAEEVIASPYLNDMTAYDSLQYGFEQVRSGYNGLAELLDREDAGRELSAMYHEMDPAAVNSVETDAEKGSYRWRMQHVETILAQEQALQRLSQIQLDTLMEDCAVKYEQKQQLADVYGNDESTIRLMGRILQQTGDAGFARTINEDPMLQSFLSQGTRSSTAVRNEILARARQYLADR